MFFLDGGGTEERSAHYYIHTRVRQASAGVCTRERKRKYRKGEEVLDMVEMDDEEKKKLLDKLK